MIQQNPDFELESDAWWIVVNGDKILQYRDKPGLFLGGWRQMSDFHAWREDIIQVGEVDSRPCYVLDMDAQHMPHEAYEGVSLRAMLMQIDTELFYVVSRAWQVALFLRTHRFCGRCGARMTRVDWELATQCHTCKHRCYPRISPCIIVAIRKGAQILLAQGRHHKNNMFSTLAGFVESGETLEHAVHREVFEEVGVKIKNLSYFSSQPWPFPHSLMCGFLAEYDSGEIKVDGDEIIEAQFFNFDALPNIPPTFSIAGQLIEATRKLVSEQ